MREVDQNTFATAHADGAIVIDVREPYEYAVGHVPGARLVPLSRLPASPPCPSRAGPERGAVPAAPSCAATTRGAGDR